MAAACAATAGCSVLLGPTPAATSAPPPAAVGTPAQLHGLGVGERVEVTVTGVEQRARPAPGDRPGAGMRYALARVAVADDGSWPYRGPIYSDIRAVAVGRLYGPVSAPGVGGSGCPHFPGSRVVPPGGDAQGCVVFAVPDRAPVSLVMFGLDGLVHTTGAVLDGAEGVWRVDAADRAG